MSWLQSLSLVQPAREDKSEGPSTSTAKQNHGCFDFQVPASPSLEAAESTNLHLNVASSKRSTAQEVSRGLA